MNKKKLFLLTAVTALTSTVLLGAAMFTKTNGFQFEKAAASEHQYSHTFTYEDILDYDEDYAILYKTTKNGNVFATQNCTLLPYSEMGDSTNNYIFKIINYGCPDYIYHDMTIFRVVFDVITDCYVENAVSGSVITTVYNYDGTTEPAVSHKMDYDYIGEDDGLYYYSLDYTFSFYEKTQQYVSIDSIVVNYSCTY